MAFRRRLLQERIPYTTAGGSQPGTSNGRRNPGGARIADRRARGFLHVLYLLGTLSGAGCSWTDHQGTHHLVLGIGFGVITTTNRPGISALNSQILGIGVLRGRLTAGWAQQQEVHIDPHAASNAVVSLHLSPISMHLTNFSVEDFADSFCQPTTNTTTE